MFADAIRDGYYIMDLAAMVLGVLAAVWSSFEKGTRKR